MVLNTWNKVKLFCGNHGEDCSCEMILHEGAAGKSPFYACPQYISIYAKKEGKSCPNRMSINDFDKMLDKIMDEKYLPDGQEISATGMRWSRNGIDFRVMDDKREGISVLVLNKKAVS